MSMRSNANDHAATAATYSRASRRSGTHKVPPRRYCPAGEALLEHRLVDVCVVPRNFNFTLLGHLIVEPRLCLVGSCKVTGISSVTAYKGAFTNCLTKFPNSVATLFETGGSLHLLYHPNLLTGRVCPDAFPSSSSGTHRRPTQMDSLEPTLGDLSSIATVAEVPFQHPVVHDGRKMNLVTSHMLCGMAHWIADQVTSYLSKAVEQFPDYRINAIGHSIGDATCMTRLIQILLFVAGNNTLLQSFFGTRLPAVIGGPYTFVLPTISIILAGRYANETNLHIVHLMKSIYGQFAVLFVI
jgi:hypothetical protein